MSQHQDVVVTSLHTFYSLSLVVTMSRHRFSCRDITVRLCRLYWLLFTSRHQVSCRDISSWYCAFEQASLVVVTSAKFSCTLPLFVVVSRHQSSCRDIKYLNCCCEWVLPGVATSTHGFEVFSCSLLDVTTSALIFCL